MAKLWIIAAFLVSFRVFGQTVILPEDPLVITRSGKGCYGSLWQELNDRVPGLKGVYMPIRRAHHLFLRSRSDCFFPFPGSMGLDVFKINPKKVVISQPVNQVGVYLLTTKQETRSLTEIAKDPGIRVAGQLGLENLVQDWRGTFFWAAELKQVYGMIALGRVDYIVVTFPDGYADFRQAGLEVVAPLILSTDNFMCKNTKLGVDAVNRINEVLQVMKNDGTLEAKLGDCLFKPEMVRLP